MKRVIEDATLFFQKAVGREYQTYSRRSYSQEGEDLVLQRLFEWVGRGDDPGFYLDVGAHHPYRFSNTFFFYLEGWRGINVDAMPGSMEAFRRSRPRDVNVEVAISESASPLTYYMFNEPALNGFDEKLARERDGVKGFRMLEARQLRTLRLSEVLAEHVKGDQAIDFMTVDVEGFDLQVLRSNDWNRYRPWFIVAEDAAMPNLDTAQACTISQYLRSNGYEMCSKAVHSMFFIDKSRKSA